MEKQENYNKYFKLALNVDWVKGFKIDQNHACFLSVMLRGC